MEIVLYLLVGLLIALAIFGKIMMVRHPHLLDEIRQANQPKTPSLPYQRADLLTAGELAFFKVLYPIVSPHWHIFTKVRMEDIINVKSGLERKEAYGFRSRIKSRHIDFVLCDKESLEILMCIELDDRSHQSAKAQESDAFKNKALEAAGVSLIRIPARSNYSEDTIKPFIFDKDPISNTPTQSPVQAATPPKQKAVDTVPTNDDPHARWKPSE